MHLIANWRVLWPKLWSIRLTLLAAVLDMVALALNMASEVVPWGWRLLLGLVAITFMLGSAVARLVVQQQVRDLDGLLTAQKRWVDRGEA